MDRLKILANVPLFAQLAKEELQIIARSTRRSFFEDGEFIIREGESDGRLYIIISGEIEVLKNAGGKNEIKLRRLGPHDFVGEMSLLDDLPRSASVVARGETQVLFLDGENLQKIIMRNPAIAVEILKVLCLRLRDSEKKIFNTMSAFLPICSNCKRVREEQGHWITMDQYIHNNTETEFTHSCCPECVRILYPGIARKVLK
jgi:CRP/FNR family transcriptional regulator, cyclic AMP receptor protein